MNENPFLIHNKSVLKTIPLIPAFLRFKSKRYMRQKEEKEKELTENPTRLRDETVKVNC